MGFRDVFAKLIGIETAAEKKAREEKLAKYKKAEQETKRREVAERRIAEERKKKNMEKDAARTKAEANSVFFENDEIRVDIISDYERDNNYASLKCVNDNQFTFFNKKTGAVVSFNHTHTNEVRGMDGYAREDSYDKYFYTKDGKKEDITYNPKACEVMKTLVHQYVDEESLKIMNEKPEKSRILGGKDVLKLVDEAKNKRRLEQERTEREIRNEADLSAKRDKDAKLLSQFVSKNFGGISK